MATELTRESWAAFQERFGNGDDGVLRGVRIELGYAWFSRSGPKDSPKAQILTSLPDRRATCGWSNVVMTVHSLEEYGLRSAEGGAMVLSEGIRLLWQNELTFIDFGWRELLSLTPAEYRKSDAYFVGRAVTYEVLPYDR